LGGGHREVLSFKISANRRADVSPAIEPSPQAGALRYIHKQ
jgi:hypothetical protein